MTKYAIQKLDGYTDGKPSWTLWSSKRYASKEEARGRIVEILQYRSLLMLRILAISK